ncbi:MAG: hypothetical protein Q6K99_00055 [Thermostichales cyanobacterium BF4_bins_65]
MKSKLIPYLQNLIVLIILLAGIISLQRRSLTAAYRSLEPAQQRLATINTARTWKHLGFSNLIAGFLWLDFVQFYGLNIIREPDEIRFRRRYHEISYDYLETITHLDPRFIQPYTVALNAVGWKQGRPDLARLLLVRGFLHRQDFSEQELIFVPLINLNLALIYLLIYASPESVAFTFNTLADWAEQLGPKIQSRLQLDPSLTRITGQNLASRLIDDPVYAEFLGWQQVFLGADDPEVQAIGRRELERIGASFRQAEDGRIIPVPPPTAEGVRRMQLNFQ